MTIASQPVVIGLSPVKPRISYLLDGVEGPTLQLFRNRVQEEMLMIASTEIRKLMPFVPDAFSSPVFLLFQRGQTSTISYMEMRKAIRVSAPTEGRVS
jgi:hypothetical protein